MFLSLKNLQFVLWKCRTFKMVKNITMFKKLIKFEIYLKINNFKKIIWNYKKILKYIKENLKTFNGCYQSFWKVLTV